MRYLHTMVRVSDVDASLDFYCNKLGMVETRRVESEKGRFTLIFLAGQEDMPGAKETRAPLLELTHNWDKEHYELGEGYGHIALGVEDIQSTCSAISKRGGRVVREPGPMKHGSTVIAFVEDPDGYKVELIQEACCAAAS